jgi:hypothetical protein
LNITSEWILKRSGCSKIKTDLVELFLAIQVRRNYLEIDERSATVMMVSWISLKSMKSDF